VPDFPVPRAGFSSSRVRLAADVHHAGVGSLIVGNAARTFPESPALRFESQGRSEGSRSDAGDQTNAAAGGTLPP